jgi:hypothetical protein
MIGEMLSIARVFDLFRGHGERLQRLRCLPGLQIYDRLGRAGSAMMQELKILHRIPRDPRKDSADDQASRKYCKRNNGEPAECRLGLGRVVAVMVRMSRVLRHGVNVELVYCILLRLPSGICNGRQC